MFACATAVLLAAAASPDQEGYRSCSASCESNPLCQSWDWDPKLNTCDFRTDRVERIVERSHGTPPPPPNPALEKLIEKYETMRNATCAKVLAKVPAVNPADAASFMTAYQAFNGNGSEDAVYSAAQKLLTPQLDTFLSLPDSTSSADGLDASMVLCAVLVEGASGGGGSPKGDKVAHALANYAVQGPAEEQTVDNLLSDFPLMRDMLVAGGAAGGNFGQAAEIYASIKTLTGDLLGPPPPGPPQPPCTDSASGAAWDDREPANVLRRLALGVAVAHAIPIGHRYAKNLPNGSKNVDPVGRFTSFAEAYRAGDLDPAFPILTAFELAHAVDSDGTDEDQAWLRRSLANYLPNEVSMSYDWRFVESVHSDVAYGDSQCGKFPVGVCSGRYADIPCGGDVCGGRAFWGRFARKGYGLPTWGATEKGHASMSSWTPTGWIRQLGSSWPFCWWGSQGGPDWYLDTQARDNRCAYQKLLRSGWVALARGDAPYSLRWTDDGQPNTQNGVGGLFSALTLTLKKIYVAESPAPNRTIPAALPPIKNKIDALIARSKIPPPPPQPITTDAAGTINIPAASFSSKNRSASIEVMLSLDEGTQLLHHGCASTFGPPCPNPSSSSWTYNFSANSAGNYYLTANFTTYHWDQDLYVSMNDAKAVEVPVYYPVGEWNQSLPLEVQIAKGENSMTFTRTTGKQLVFKEFFLSVKKPDVPQPPGNYTPAPAPPPAPPGGDFIEVPASTSCVAQGIKDVPEQYCGEGCTALGFKYTGSRGRPNISGCFVMDTGQYAGNCNYNSNTSATCTPPCTLFGATVRKVCLRT